MFQGTPVPIQPEMAPATGCLPCKCTGPLRLHTSGRIIRTLMPTADGWYRQWFGPLATIALVVIRPGWMLNYLDRWEKNTIELAMLLHS